MTYQMKPLSCDPSRLKGLSEKLIVSHYENNYGGAVKRLNSICDQLASLDPAVAPVFVLNGLKREQLIAMNSMILHELYFDGLGAGDGPGGALSDAIKRDFGSIERWRGEFVAMGQFQLVRKPSQGIEAQGPRGAFQGVGRGPPLGVAPQAGVTASQTSLANSSSVAVKSSGLYSRVIFVSGISAASDLIKRTASTAIATTSALLMLNTVSRKVGQVAL